jgi:hypothetical protein
MRKALIAIIVLLGASSCSSEPTGVADAAQVAGVQLEGLFYFPAGELDPATVPLGARYATVLRHVDCSDGIWVSGNTHIEDYCPLKDGDSNFLAAGTPIYRIEGVLPSERLAVLDHRSWIFLKASSGTACGGTSPAQPGTLSPPGCGE